MSHRLHQITFLACFLSLLTLTADAAGVPKPAPKITLFDTYEALAMHFGKAGGAVLYDPKSKSLLINGFNFVATGGYIQYYGNWEELDFDIAWDKLAVATRKPNVVLTVGTGTDRSVMESVDVSGAFLAPGKYAVKITYKAHTLSFYVNDRLAHKPVAVTHPEAMEALQLNLRASFANIRLFNPEVIGTLPEGNPPANRQTPKPPVHPRVISLFQTVADFEKRWPYRKGVEYDPGTKTITIPREKDFPSYIASFHYGAPWQQLELTLNCGPSQLDGRRPPSFDVGLNAGGEYVGEVFLLDRSLARIGKNQLKLVIENGHTLTAYLNGKQSGEPMTLLRDIPITHLRFQITTGNPTQISDVKITADPES